MQEGYQMYTPFSIEIKLNQMALRTEEYGLHRLIRKYKLHRNNLARTIR